MMKKICVAAIAFMLYMHTGATQLIPGQSKPVTIPTGCPQPITTTFNVGVQSITYDVANGIFYAGLMSGGDIWAVSSFKRTFDQVCSFTPRAIAGITNSLQNAPIQYLAMATATGDTCSRVAGVNGNKTDEVFLLDITNRVFVSPELNLFNPLPNKNGVPASNIVGLAANRCFIFAAVSPGQFGADDSGVAVVAIDQCTLALNQTAAVPGDMGIKAAKLDNSSAQLHIPETGGTATITITGNIANMRSNSDALLLWDDQLQRLYAGVSEIVISNAPGDGGISVLVGIVGDCPQKGTLVFQPIAPGSAFMMGSTTGIVGVIPQNPPAGTTENLSVFHLGMMHCSTGPSYLIVHGGNGTDGNHIFAIPLVDTCNDDDPNQGTMANKNMFNVATHRFIVPADMPIDAVQSTDPAAQVGNGPIPIEGDQTISYMQVIGDAVYISLKIPQNDTNETGILYSQAQFDNEGRIQSWTPWTKRVWPICGFPNSPSNGQVSFFAVDAVTGKVIAVDGTPQQTVRITRWDDGEFCTPCCGNCSLAGVINRSLCDGCYSVLDLDQSTRGIGTDIPFRYALFGGTGKVDFALTSSSRAPAGPPFNIDPATGIPFAQKVTVDFCCPDFFLETELSGCVNVLEYSRRTEAEGNTNYFFAGTDEGLFVFTTTTGQGFTDTQFNFLNQPPFCNGVWQKIANLSEPITDIKTTGNQLYVMTFTTRCDEPFHSEIKSIAFENNINDMFALPNIVTIASSGPGSASPALQQTLLFTQMEIIQTSTDTVPLQEQLVLTTNNGIFQSKRTDGVQGATSEADANWTSLQNNSLFYGIGAIDNPSVMSTVWPFNAQDACGVRSFERSSIYQLNGELDPMPTFNFVPSFFNHMITCDSCACEIPCPESNPCCPETTPTPCDLATTACNTSCDPVCCCIPELVNNPCSGLKLFDKINYFWSDGGRRFFIVTPANGNLACIPCCGKSSCHCCPQQNLRFLEVTPFNTCAWNVCDPIQTILHDCALRTQSAFYWVRPIGMTGVILAGTQAGVVALE